MLLIALLACTRAPIENTWSHGSITQVKDLFTSAFVVNTDAGVVLVDTGFNEKSKPVLKALAKQNKQASDVVAVLVTHGHTDHINGALNFPEAVIYAHEDEQPLLAEAGITSFTSFQDQEILSFGESSFEIFHVKGHTDGNVVILVDDVLIMGDTAQSYKDGSISTVDEKYSEDPELANQSLKELGTRLESRAEDISWIVFSHSGALAGTHLAQIK